MRFVFGVILVLTTAITIWLMTLNSPSPDPDVSELSTSVELSRHERNSNEENTAQPELARTNDTIEHKDLSLVEQALLRFPHISAHELEAIFANNPELKKIRVDFIIALIERGDMAADELITNFRFWGPYTVAQSAAGNAPHDLTLDQFNKLIELGADVNGEKLWRIVMAKQTNGKVLDKWYTHAALGPEVHKELFGNAITFGNTALYDFLTNGVGTQLVLNEEEDKYISELTNEVKGSLDGYAQLKQQLDETSDAKKHLQRQNLINRLQRWHGQAQILKAMSDDESERAELEQVAAQLSQKLKEFAQH
ncbi:hypothetical protein [Pseudidiomarina homiensis]|uniref:Uncharacterized protein n=1 Tax=Pseudidiomarina homiensis TaxID=364198 RepID=A0A432Y7A0_9GAMM|nr:hypothetical protein [Pseudidiomarina homiensis]RUO56823.1 hypothetical protein CWI70_08845 [Pseudidiomarina homiensis]